VIPRILEAMNKPMATRTGWDELILAMPIFLLMAVVAAICIWWPFRRK
jgi:hypothetical protein